MATLTADRNSLAVAGHGYHGNLKVAYGTYEIAANPSAADIIQLCKLPAGARVVGGHLYMDEIDTNATETLDIDLGWAANGGSGTYDSADPDGLGNFGVLQGDAFANPSISATVGSVVPLSGVLADGDLPRFTRETQVQAVVNAAAATFTAGAISAVIYYVVQDEASPT